MPKALDLHFLGFHCSVLGTACQRATVETLWPVSSFSFKVWLETNRPNRQTETKPWVFANFLLKCYSNIKEKCVIPQSFCLLTYSWLRLLVSQVFSMAEVIGWHWIPAKETLLQGLCVINTLSHIQQSSLLQKYTEPKLLTSAWLLNILPSLLTRN